VATRFHLVEGMCKLKTCTHKKARASPEWLYKTLTGVAVHFVPSRTTRW